MNALQPTLAEQLAVPMVMFVCTGIIAFVGFLLSYGLKQRDRQLQNLEEDIEKLQGQVIQIRTIMGLKDRPSDVVIKKGESSA